MHRHKLDKEENLFKAFQHFDKDDSGYGKILFPFFFGEMAFLVLELYLRYSLSPRVIMVFIFDRSLMTEVAFLIPKVAVLVPN